ncbi:MAG: branched-chain amino acid ABC transporter permease [Clostridiales bacterium]|nr:branched-chain amino acid ABC transporter permease [Clostridiales bacterium]
MKKKNKLILPVIIWAACIALLYILDRTLPSGHMLFIVLKKGAIYALVAVSMNLLNGFTGLFSLGQAGFMLIGAYTYAIFTIPVEAKGRVYQYYDCIVNFSLPVVVALILAGLFAAVFAWLIGLPVLRLKSDYLAIATLGFAEIIKAVFLWKPLGPITNGSNLLKNFPTFNSLIPATSRFYPIYTKHIAFFSTLFPLAVAAICITLVVLLINSSYGRAFKAIREDEIAAEAMGINLARHKRLSLCASSFFAGIGGALLAMFQATIAAAQFKSAMTYELLLIVVIGGIGSISGSCIASFLFVACSEWWLRFLDSEIVLANVFKVPFLRNGFRLVVFSVIIMIVVLFFRRGIMGDQELPDLLRKRLKRKKEAVQ